MNFISIIIPVYNAETTIVEALESVKMQSFRDYEIIIINDGSTDGSVSKIMDFVSKNIGLPIQMISQENKGVSAARNAGIAIAKGNYIALLDADDVWLPQKLEKQMQLFSEKKMDFLATAGEGKRILFPYICNNQLVKISFRKLLFRNEILLPSVIFKKEIVDRVGAFDVQQTHAEDVNLWLRITEFYTMYLYCEPLIIAGKGKRTFGVSGLSADLGKMHSGFIKNLKELNSKKRINYFTYQLLYIFYKMKYIILLMRKK